MDIVDINIGCALQVQLMSGNSNLRDDVQYIGCLPGKYIFVSKPSDSVFLSRMTVSDRLAIRYLDQRNILGFETLILNITSGQDSFLQLKYPARIERVELRKAERIPVKIDVSIMKDGNVHKGVITNLSSTGAMLYTPVTLGEINDDFKMCFEVKFGALNNAVKTAATIRNIHKPTNGQEGMPFHRYGIEFIDMTEQELLYVQGSIYEYMARNRMVLAAS